MLVKQRIYISLLLLSLLPIALVAVLTEKVEEDIIEQLITRDLQSLAREKSLGIERLLDERIHEVRLIARHPALVKRVQDSNKQYQNRNHQEVLQEIQLLDENWITHKGSTPRAQSVAINELSKLLLEIQTSHPEVYGEMFVTDALGATVAMTKTLSDYYQADEYWWQKGLDYAEKGAFLDDRGYDESVGAIVIGVVVPIVDNGIVVGMFKVNFLVKAVIDIVAGETLEEGYSLLLGRSDGSVIIGSQERYPDRLSQDALEAIRTVPEGGWISTLQGEENFAVYYPVKQRFITRETKSPQIGGVNEVTSEKTWYLVYEVEHDVAFAALQDLHETVIKMGGEHFYWLY